jgi:hypothetical protein
MPNGGESQTALRYRRSSEKRKSGTIFLKLESASPVEVPKLSGLLEVTHEPGLREPLVAHDARTLSGVIRREKPQ